MVLRHTPIMDYVPHCVRRDIMIHERARIDEGKVPTITNLMNHYAIPKAAAESILNKLNEEKKNDRDT